MRASALVVASCKRLLQAELPALEAAARLVSGEAATTSRPVTDLLAAAAGRRALHRWAHPLLPGKAGQGAVPAGQVPTAE